MQKLFSGYPRQTPANHQMETNTITILPFITQIFYTRPPRKKKNPSPLKKMLTGRKFNRMQIGVHHVTACSHWPSDFFFPTCSPIPTSPIICRKCYISPILIQNSMQKPIASVRYQKQNGCSTHSKSERISESEKKNRTGSVNRS